MNDQLIETDETLFEKWIQSEVPLSKTDSPDTSIRTSDDAVIVEAKFSDDLVYLKMRIDMIRNGTSVVYHGNSLKITVTRGGKYAISILTLSGELLHEGEKLLYRGDNMLSGIALAQGVYLISLQNEIEQIQLKCVVP